MKTTPCLWRTLAALATVLLTVQTIPAATIIWNGASGADTNWSTPGNWTGGAAPTSTDDVKFFDGGADPTIGNINNVVDSLFTGTVLTLQYGQTINSHTTLIEPGNTLTVLGNFVVGTEAIAAANLDATITGAGGSLVISNSSATVFVRQGGDTASRRATLDLSGLDTLLIDASRIFIGRADPPGVPNINRNTGWVYLAKTNRISLTSATATSSSTALELGRSGSNNGGGSRLYLGQTNEIHASGLGVGLEKETGCQMLFNAIFTDPVVHIRGADGSERMSLWTIGDGESNSGTTSCQGTCDFTGGTVDARVDALTIGRASSNTGGTGNSRGTLTFNAGIIDANTLQVGLQTATTGKNGDGTVNVNGGTLRVNGNVELARSTGGAGAALTAGRLIIGGGTVQVAGDLVEFGTAGTSTISLNSGTLDMQPPGDLSPGNLTADTVSIGTLGPAVLANAATISVTSLTIGSEGVIAGPTTIDLASGAAMDVSAIGGGFTLGGTQRLQGAGSVTGQLIQGSGAWLVPGGKGIAGTLTFNNELTLNENGTLLYDLSNDPFQVGGANDLITVFGNLNLSGTNDVFINAISGDLANGNYRLLDYFGLLTGDATYFEIAGPIAQSRRTFAFDTGTANQVNLVVGGAAGLSLTWSGDGSANLWNINAAANWNGGSEKFFNLDAVTFDDSGSETPAVNLVGTLVPGSITVNNSTRNYAFTGSGAISGGTGLSKQGSGVLTIANSGNNDFTGDVTISAGTLQFGDGSTIGNLPAGAGIANDGALVFHRSDNLAVPNVISGSGSLTKNNTNTLTLSGDNTYEGATTVAAGTLKVVNNASLGSIPGGAVTVASGATLDLGGNTTVNNANYGAKQFNIAGAGADGSGVIINSGSAQQINALQNIVLTAEATIGGPGDYTAAGNPGRWDIRGGTPALDLGGFTLTKIGSNQVTLVAVAVTGGNIVVNQGVFSAETSTTFTGSGTLTVNSGATLGHFRNDAGAFTRPIVLNGGTIRNLAGSGNPTINDAPITLTADSTLHGSGTAAYPITFNGGIAEQGGARGLTKIGVGSVILAGTNTYSGSTLINEGTLALQGNGSISGSANVTVAAGATIDASGRTDQTLTVAGGQTLNLVGTGTIGSGTLTIDVAGGATLNASARADSTLPLASGQTLKGNGTVNGNVTVLVGTTVSPGASVGKLTVSGVVNLLGTTRMEVNKASATNDVLQSETVIIYGGTLSVTNLDGDLAAEDSFKLFNAASFLGAFTSFDLPALGAGLTWDTDGLTNNGTLKVVGSAAAPQIGSITLSGAEVIISGTGGTAGEDYYVLTSTNVALPVAEWQPVLTNTFGTGGSFSFTNTVDPGLPRRFFLLQLP